MPRYACMPSPSRAGHLGSEFGGESPPGRIGQTARPTTFRKSLWISSLNQLDPIDAFFSIFFGSLESCIGAGPPLHSAKRLMASEKRRKPSGALKGLGRLLIRQSRANVRRAQCEVNPIGRSTARNANVR
jgi:hypothetical protein